MPDPQFIIGQESGLPVPEPQFGLPSLPQLMMNDGAGQQFDTNAGGQFDLGGAAGADPLAPAVPEQAAPQAPVQQEQEVEQQRQRGGGMRPSVSGPNFNQQYRYTQEDFYGRDKDITWTDPRGVQMYVPQAGKLPMAIMASRMQQVQAERQQNRANLEKLIQDTSKGIKTADPYQQSFNRLLRDKSNSFVAGIAAQYGGNEQLAWKEIANNPSTRKAFIDLHKDMEGFAARAQSAWEMAEGYVKEASNPNVMLDPTRLAEAEEILYAIGSMRGDDGGDINALNKKIVSFTKGVSKEKFIKDFIDPSFKERYQQMSSEIDLAKRQGGVNVFEIEKGYTMQPFLEEAARSMLSRFPDETYESLLKMLKGRYPDKVETSYQLRNAPKPKGSGGSGASGEGFRYTTSQSRPPQDLLEKLRDPLTGNMPSQNLEWPTVNLFDIVSKRGQTPYARVFVSETGDNVYLHPTRIMDVNGQKYIIGKETGMPRTQAQKDKDEKGKTPEQRALAREARRAAQEAIDNGEPVNVEVFKDLPDIAIPYNEQNAALIEGSFGLSMSEVDTMLKSTQSKQQGGGKADTTEADIKKAFPGAIKDPKHGWVAKDENGKWRKVTL
jgi:hypothetical protein